MVEYPSVAVAVAVPCGLFFASGVAAVVWVTVMWFQARAAAAREDKEKEEKAAVLKARQ